jgi:hypothetical protein
MDKIHFIEGDTDSMYYAVAGDPEAGIHQQFDNVVKDIDFYYQHRYEWFPDPAKGKEDEKKLGGVAVENEGSEMYAVAPKNYTIIKPGKPILKNKGVSLNKNKHITPQSYISNLNTGEVIKGENKGFGIKGNTMTKYSVDKVAISGIHTKMIVLKSNACAPYVFGLKVKDYFVVK